MSHRTQNNPSIAQDIAREISITAMLLTQAIIQKNANLPLWRLSLLSQSEVKQVCSMVRNVITPEELVWFKAQLLAENHE